eukprot:6876472-Prorocentrum_lima.AAC.1
MPVTTESVNRKTCFASALRDLCNQSATYTIAEMPCPHVVALGATCLLDFVSVIVRVFCINIDCLIHTVPL